MSYTDKERAFLLELTALSRKHNIVVSGCGCCGSPSLAERDCSNAEAGYGTKNCDVEWMSPGDYDWDKCRSTVVRP